MIHCVVFVCVCVCVGGSGLLVLWGGDVVVCVIEFVVV